jgi:hypothetical protein
MVNHHIVSIVLASLTDVDRANKGDCYACRNVRRGKQWFRYDVPDQRLFRQLQKTLAP